MHQDSTTLPTRPPLGEPQLDYLRFLLDRHAAAGGVTEIRVRGKQGIWAGRFGPEHAALVANLLRPRCAGSGGAHPRSGEADVWAVLNPVSDDGLLPVGKLVRSATTAGDNHVVAPSLLLIDCDPVRPPKHSATDDEKRAAGALADEIGGWLTSHEIHYLRADSGNGYHLLVPVCGTGAPGISKRLLQALGERFDTPDAQVDRATHNPARCAKLYGTWAVKGEPTAERPHRISSIALDDAPPPDNTWEQIESLCAPLAGPSRPALDPRIHRERVASDASPAWSEWREQALAALPLEAVYGDLLTGRRSGTAWLEARDPSAPSGDQNPSAGVADGSGEAERGTFHSFRGDGASLSVFDFLTRAGRAADFRGARELVASLSGVPCPGARRTEPRGGLTAPTVVAGVASQGRPVVEFAAKRDSIEAVHGAITRVLRSSGTVYRRGSELVSIRPGSPPKVITRDNVAGEFAAWAEYAFVSQSKDGEVRNFAVLPQSIGASWVENPVQREAFPRVNAVLFAPQFGRDWTWRGTPGYDRDSATFYVGPSVPVLAPETAILDDLLSEFPWRSEADRVNFLGALLTVVTLVHWGSGHPFLFVDGNQPGLGKSKLGRMLGILSDGEEPRPITYTSREDEFEKRLATGLAKGRHVMLIDNVREDGPAISSASLEVATVSPRPSFRRLGSNDVIERPINDLLFVVTGNGGQLNRDLARRMLPVRLQFDGDPQQREFLGGDPVERTQLLRHQLLGVLAGMVAAWVEAGQPRRPRPARHSTNDAWAATIDGILLQAGYDGFLANWDEASEATDPQAQLLHGFANTLWREEPAYASEWVGRIAQAGLQGPWKQDASQKSRETSFANLFNRYRGRTFEVAGGVVTLRREDGRKPLYAFEFVPSHPS